MTERASGPDQMHPTGGPDTPHRGRCWPVVVAAGYVLVAGWLVWLSRSQVNPDGVAYIQIARHYAQGRFDLAVNSYWSPLLSWLLAPAAALRLDMLLAVKCLNAFLGLGFAAATMLLARKFGARWDCLLPLAAGALLALSMLPEPITPDILLALLMTGYFALAVQLLDGDSVGKAFRAGVVGGLAGLAKTYALAFIPAHLVVTLLLRRLAGGKGGGRMFLAGLAGLAGVAGPWIVAISIKDRRPTVGSVGRLADTFVWSIQTGHNPPMYALQQPRPGRLTVWEDPTEIAEQHIRRAERPFGLDYRIGLLQRNLGEVLHLGAQADPFVLLLVGSVLAGIIFLRGGHSGRPDWPLAVWVGASIALYAGGYLLVLMESRYLWPAWGLLGAALIRLIGGKKPASTSDAQALPRPAAMSAAGPSWLRQAAAALAMASVLYALSANLGQWLGPSGKRSNWQRFTAACAGFERGRLTASNRWHEGLYASFRTDSPFLGQVSGSTAQAIAEELSPFGPVRLLVFSDRDLAGRLAVTAWFEPAPGPSNQPDAQAFTCRPCR